MKILLAPDKFKEVLTAQELSEILRNLIQKKVPQAQIRLCPVADGGEGTLNSIIYLLKGKLFTETVYDPLMRPKQAQYGMADLPKKGTAIVEMSLASGLYHLTPAERNPLETTSYGVGELVGNAVKHGATQIKIFMGGSATVDGGLGFLQALGAIPRGRSSLPKGLSGKHLSSILSIDLAPAIFLLNGVTLTGLVDVQVPLLGDHGAARFFGPQKGATPEMVEELEKGLFHWETVLSEASGQLLKNNPRSGAAGGLGMAILALGGSLEKGFDFVAQTLKLEDQMRECDLVITGEGWLDSTSREGKAPVAVARIAKKLGIPCVVIAGTVDSEVKWLSEEGISKAYSLFDTPFVTDDPRKPQVPQRLADIISKIFPQGNI